MKTLLTALLALLAIPAAAPRRAQEAEPQTQRAAVPEGTRTVDELIDAVYRTVSFPAGAVPDWDALRALMLPEALIVQPLVRGRAIVATLHREHR